MKQHVPSSHLVRPDWHWQEHDSASNTSPPEKLVSQLELTHLPLHSVWPVGHSHWHVPGLKFPPGGQVVLTQLPLQSVVLLVQTHEHVVLLKTCPPVQLEGAQRPLQSV